MTALAERTIKHTGREARTDQYVSNGNRGRKNKSHRISAKEAISRKTLPDAISWYVSLPKAGQELHIDIGYDLYHQVRDLQRAAAEERVRIAREQAIEQARLEQIRKQAEKDLKYIGLDEVLEETFPDHDFNFSLGEYKQPTSEGIKIEAAWPQSRNVHRDIWDNGRSTRNPRGTSRDIVPNHVAIDAMDEQYEGPEDFTTGVVPYYAMTNEAKAPKQPLLQYEERSYR